MRKTLSLLVIAVILSGCSTLHPVEKVRSSIWVSISFQRGPENDSANALLSAEVYNALMSGRLSQGWLELKNVYWENAGQLRPLRVAGSKWGYGDDYLIKIESINRIVPLSKEMVGNINKIRED